MIEINHDLVVAVSKSYGLFYLVALSIAAGIYAYWPANRGKFNAAKKAILEDEEGPCL